MRRELRTWVRASIPWFIVGGLALYVISSLGERFTPGDPAPPIEGTLSTGTTFSLTERRGHLTVLNFWATWCPACRAEAPALSKVQPELQALGGTVVGISLDDATLDQVERFARRLGVTYPLMMTTPAITRAYRVDTLPTTYVIDSQGKIAWSRTGAVDAEDVLEAVREAQLSAPKHR